ncbi:MAG: hypothetical protein J3K34DRAFT_525947 [Monoraphidium minutum]|nr:MAG: hypothetical protein J3K34DRAFT_525947 [Monoraphidium minutum]
MAQLLQYCPFDLLQLQAGTLSTIELPPRPRHAPTRAPRAAAAWQLLRQVAALLCSLEKLLHRDFCGRNLRAVYDEDVVAADFGEARAAPALDEPGVLLTSGVGKEGLRAPETWTGVYGRPADMYSAGMALAEVAAKRPHHYWNPPGSNPAVVARDLCKSIDPSSRDGRFDGHFSRLPADLRQLAAAAEAGAAAAGAGAAAAGVGA